MVAERAAADAEAMAALRGRVAHDGSKGLFPSSRRTLSSSIRRDRISANEEVSAIPFRSGSRPPHQMLISFPGGDTRLVRGRLHDLSLAHPLEG
jgi:hypothetical protein